MNRRKRCGGEEVNMSRGRQLISLFLTMMKIGLFSFGGGYAMLALVETELVSKKRWIGKEEFLDMVAISESTPGPLAINSATYIGYRLAGVIGALTATAAVVLPSFTILFAISFFFDAFLSFSYVAYAFQGIRVCVVFLILSAGFGMLKSVRRHPLELTVLGATFLGMLLTSLFAVDFSSIFYILIGGAAGLFVFLLFRIKRGKGGTET